MSKYNDVQLVMRGEGPGLTEDDRKKLYGKFQKLSTRPSGEESTTGLGLSIVKKYTEAMGVKISCESEFGKGTAFIIEYKLATNG